MESSKLTDEELIELAKKELEGSEDDDRMDIGYYQERFLLVDGNFKVYIDHLYKHYKNWSSDPISLSIFKDMLKLKRKNSISCFIDKDKCNLDLDKLVGDYVKEKRTGQKEKRLRQVPSFKPKT